jgi:hypothetical protein
VVRPATDADRQHNSTVARWWRDRALLGEQVRNVQTETLHARDVGAAGRLYHQLAATLQAALAVERHWQTIFHGVYARGSAFRTRPAFVPRWCVLGPTTAALVYEFGAPPADVHEVEHASASLVFESVCMAYLRCALQQQMATLANQCAEPGMPGEAELLTFLLRALGALRELCDSTLPLHFELRNGTEPFLLAAHFYRSYLARLVSAQHCWLLATHEHRRDEPLGAAALFAHAARQLEAAQRTPYGAPALLGALALQRRSLALMTLAQALSAAERETVLESPLVYVGARPTEVVDYQALAVEAYYCARAAYALNARAEPVRRQYESIAQRLQSMYGAVLPADSAYDVPAATAAELRMHGATKSADWRREYGQITIEARIQPGARALHATHKVPTSSVVSVGAERRHFVLACFYELK